MPAKATLQIAAAAGLEKADDKFEFEADSALAVTEHKICANGDAHIDLYAGPRENIKFFMLKSDAYVVPNACDTGDRKWIRFGFPENPGDKLLQWDLKHFLVVTPPFLDTVLPEHVAQLYVQNDLTVDIKISVLAARKSPKKEQNGSVAAQNAGQPVPIGQ